MKLHSAHPATVAVRLGHLLTDRQRERLETLRPMSVALYEDIESSEYHAAMALHWFAKGRWLAVSWRKRPAQPVRVVRAVRDTVDPYANSGRYKGD